MSKASFNDLRTFIEECNKIGECKEITGINWDLELGAVTEAAAERISEPPMLLFDRIKDYPPGHRVVSLPFASTKRAALSLGLPLEVSKLELARLAARKLKEAATKSIPPVEVSDGPVLENKMVGDEVNLFKFPTPRFHAQDGGRYLGTGDTVINQDPESGYVNMGTYRMQIHERNLLGLWMSPGQQGRQICERYWQDGKSCPLVATFGGDPRVYMASHIKLPWGKSELGLAGGLRGEALEIIRGPITGLPIPARAEIAIEGEVPPPEVEARDEGPFGEWPGYYSGGSIGTGRPQPVIKVKAIYHRSNPIIHNQSPMWPGAPGQLIPIQSGLIWEQLESAGIQDVVGAYAHSYYMVVVAIRQRYPGHARQAGLAAASCAAAARNGRYVVIVDEDIDPTNLKEVFWAMMTRVDPTTDIETIPDCWSTPLDPRMPPEKRASGDYTNSRAIFYAVRPFTWRSKFPRVSRCSPELLRQVVEKYKNSLPFSSEGRWEMQD